MIDDYDLKIKFFKKFSYFILNLKIKEIEMYLKPFFEEFKILRKQDDQEDFFNEFVLAEDVLNQYENFWTVWDMFYPKIVEICNEVSSYQFNLMDTQIIYNYLLCGPWKENAKSWHTLKAREKLFFKKVSKEIGHHPAVLYSIAKLLNGIGSNFKDDGILWVSDIINSNPNLCTADLKINTIFYIENIIRSYIFKNHQIIKTQPQRKRHVITILNFLIDKGSATAYRLRETII